MYIQITASDSIFFFFFFIRGSNKIENVYELLGVCVCVGVCVNIFHIARLFSTARISYF